MLLLEVKNILKIEWEKLNIDVKSKDKITCSEFLEKLNNEMNKMTVTDANFTSDPNRWCFEITGEDMVVTLDGKPVKEDEQTISKGE